ncbi:MAG: endonuclease/exonuclease/phosphatase family protein [Rikenellaceae bacterium]
MRSKSDNDRGKRGESPIKRAIAIILKIITIAMGFALLLTLIAPYVAPQSLGLLPTLALVAPATFVVNLLFMLYWFSTWEWRYGVVLLLILGCCIGRVSLFMKYSPTQEYQKPNYRGATKVMSYNVRTLKDDDGESVSKRVCEYLDESGCDIICLQEFYGTNSRKVERYMPKVAKYNLAQKWDLRIYTRYPIVDRGDIFEKYGFESGHAIWADVVVSPDTLRVVAAHLQSTSIKVSDSDYLTSSKVMTDNNSYRKVLNIVRRYQLSCIARAEQARALAAFVGESPYPIVVTGDFNDTPASYAYNTVSRGMSDSFRECGNGYSYTFRGFFNMLRIDYILTGDRVTPLSYSVDKQMNVSDHLPVTSHVKIEKRK